MCHCLACQRRTGSAFGIQARWPRERVDVSGRCREYVRISDAGEERMFRFCPDCGSARRRRIRSCTTWCVIRSVRAGEWDQ
ncbi:MAG: GFA family protein [Gaiellaceae bacterium]